MYTANQLYPAFNEIDDLLIEYNELSTDKKLYGMFSEFGITDGNAVVIAATERCWKLIEKLFIPEDDFRIAVYKKFYEEYRCLLYGLMGINNDSKIRIKRGTVVAKEDTDIKKGQRIAHDFQEDMSFFANCWIEGFLTHLIIQEMNNYRWTNITAKMVNKFTNQPLRAELLDCKGLMSIHERIVKIHYDSMGKSRPSSKIPLPRADRAKILIGKLCFLDGISMATTVEFRKDE